MDNDKSVAIVDPELGVVELIADDDTKEEKQRKRDETDEKIKEVEKNLEPPVDSTQK